MARKAKVIIDSTVKQITVDNYVDKVKAAVKHTTDINSSIIYGNTQTSSLFENTIGGKTRSFFQFGGPVPKFSRKLQRSSYMVFDGDNYKIDSAISSKEIGWFHWFELDTLYN